MRFYTTERLGPKRARSPEGYLICLDAPLARTGLMMYGPGETPIEPAPGQDRVRIYRHPEEVFSDKTIASYAGKPLVDDHPEDDVTPDNHRELSKGIILNPRRGTGNQDDLLLGDILVTDPEVIKLIESGEKTELSAGYDADYEQTAPGEGVQKNILVNHVALVDSGRCGPRCKIGDQAPKEKETTFMSTVADRIKALMLRAHKAKDAAELEPIEKEAESLVTGGAGGEGAGGEHHVHVHLGAGGGVAKEKDDDLPGGGAGAGAGAGFEGGGEEGEGDLEQRVDSLEEMLDAICEKMGVGDKAARDARRGLRDKRYKDRTGKDRKRNDAAPEGETEEERKAREQKDNAMRDDETIEGALEMEAPPGTGDKARKAKDSAYLADSFQLLMSQIEIITPGARAPTFDHAARPAVTYSTMCGMRAESLERAYATNDSLREFMDTLNNGRKPEFKKMTCDSARVMMAAVAAQASTLNNKGAARSHDAAGFGTYAATTGVGGGLGVKGAVMTPADLNAMARKLYNREPATTKA